MYVLSLSDIGAIYNLIIKLQLRFYDLESHSCEQLLYGIHPFYRMLGPNLYFILSMWSDWTVSRSGFNMRLVEYE